MLHSPHPPKKGQSPAQAIASCFPGSVVIVYRIDPYLKALLWNSALLPKDCRAHNIRILKKIHIPLDSGGFLSKNLEGKTEQRISIEREFNGIYENQFRELLPLQGALLAIPLRLGISEKTGGLALLNGTEASLQKELPKNLNQALASYLLELSEKWNEKRKTLKQRHIDDKKPKGSNKSALFLDLKGFSNSPELAGKTLWKIEEIFRGYVQKFQAQILSIASWRLAALLPTRKGNATALIQMARSIQQELIELQKQSPFNFQIGIATSPLFQKKRGGRQHVWGPAIVLLDRLTRSSPQGCIQIDETSLQKIPSRIPCKFRGNIRHTKSGAQERIYVLL